MSLCGCRKFGAENLLCYKQLTCLKGRGMLKGLCKEETLLEQLWRTPQGPSGDWSNAGVRPS